MGICTITAWLIIKRLRLKYKSYVKNMALFGKSQKTIWQGKAVLYVAY